MNSNHIARQYRELAVKGATPVGLIILLYDMVIESLAHATREIEAGNIEARTAEFNHAIAVIGELQRSLNFEAGGEVAKRLTDFYDVARCKILEANIKSSKEIIERLSGVLCSIREAWQAVEQENGSRPAMDPAPETPRSSPASTAPGQQEEERPQLQWSA
jgi:flagellar protein FliS